MKAETKVGIMFVGAIIMVVLFAYFLGAFNPFSNAHTLYVDYRFAGGIEKGSPVRVMGIKVGKVKEIVFQPGDEAKLRLKISVDKAAWESIRSDSHFFINLAGVIGEKFLEITPGSSAGSPLSPGAVVRGDDPPRIDQLISQSYGLAGKIIDFVEQNEGSAKDTIETLNKLVLNLNKALKQIDRTTRNKDIQKMLDNMVIITDDVAFFTQQVRSSEGQDTIALFRKLLKRLEPLDAKAIKEFLQEEGIKARLF